MAEDTQWNLKRPLNWYDHFTDDAKKYANTAWGYRNKALSQPIFGKTGPTISTVAPYVQGGLNAIGAVNNISQLSKVLTGNEDISDDIVGLAASNPQYAAFLSPEHRKLLQSVKSGTFQSSDFGDTLSGVWKGLPNTLLQAGLGFLTGNVPGAIVGGVGSLINNALEGNISASDASSNRLNELYNSLASVDQEFSGKRRQRVVDNMNKYYY